ncbi:hypothetical protein LINGRAHAP2_LOCUS36079 [Linum grandiflorum]
MMTMAMIVEPVAASRFAAGANIRCSAAPPLHLNLLCERGEGGRASRSEGTEYCLMLHRSTAVVRLLDQLSGGRRSRRRTC